MLIRRLIAPVFLIGFMIAVLFLTANRPSEQAEQDGFADRALAEAISAELQQPLTEDNLLKITKLDASGRGIVSLRGIEKLRNLESLNLQDNFIKDLAPLAELKKLTELNLRNNEITDLEAVNFSAIIHLPLRKLGLRHNVYRFPQGGQVRLSDISLLQYLTELEELELRDNHIADIAPLGFLRKLRVLDLRENRITEISPLGNLAALEELNLRDNYISDITALEDCQNLVYLNLHSNYNIKSIEPIAKLTNLQVLILRNVPVGDQISVLRNLKNLYRLNLRNCNITDLEVLGELMSMGALQDDPDSGIEAEVDIRDNNLHADPDYYEPVRKWWGNITHRFPHELEQ